MSNHVHLLLKVEKEDIDLIIKRIASSYVYWYNWKYKRNGHLFQDRFKSEPVENDSYFLTMCATNLYTKTLLRRVCVRVLTDTILAVIVNMLKKPIWSIQSFV